MLQALIVATWLSVEVVNMTTGGAENVVRELQEIVTISCHESFGAHNLRCKVSL